MPPLPAVIQQRRPLQRRSPALLSNRRPGPVTVTWDGEAFWPVASQRSDCDERFIVGAHYRLSPADDRSDASHRHEFAWLREAWLQLPEELASLYPSPEHLRKRALIAANFYDEDAIDAGTHDGAARMAAWIRAKDDFCLVKVVGPIVLVRTAKSQSKQAMGKREFQESKDAILLIVSGLIGISPDELRRNAERAA
jgi:hypothetical protein